MFFRTKILVLLVFGVGIAGTFAAHPLSVSANTQFSEDTFENNATTMQILATITSIKEQIAALRAQLAEIETPETKQITTDTVTTDVPGKKDVRITDPGFVYRNGMTGGNWIQSLSKTEGLRVVWWNLGCRVAKGNKNTNLQALLSEDTIRPDVLMLGEFCPSAVTAKTKRLLSQYYPYTHTVDQYTKFHGENGMRVYSQVPLQNANTRKIKPITGFLNKKYIKNCKAKNIDSKFFEQSYWQRPVMTFNVTKDGKTYPIVGAHFANPWPTIADCLGSQYKAGLQMMNGKDNPNYAQAEAIVRLYGKSKDLLLIGDFNAPKQTRVGLLRVNSNSYSLLQRAFGTSVIKENTATSFSKFGNRSIDHAFTIGDIRAPFAKVLPFEGSDHAALYTVIK